MSYSFSISLKDFASSKLFKMQLALSSVSDAVLKTTSKVQSLSKYSSKSIDNLNNKLNLLHSSEDIVSYVIY